MTVPRRSLWTLLLVVAAFATPFLIAVVLRFGGWQPGQTRNYGELLAPPLPMAAVQGLRDDGSPWPWVNQEHEWTLLLRPADPCDADCAALAEVLPRVRTALGRHAGRLHLFAVGGAAAAGLPALRLQGELPLPLQATPARAAEAWLVDPHGYLVMHYPAGFDANGLRRDLGRLIK